MDRRTDDVKSVYPPFNFVEAVGIIMREHCIGQTAWAAVIIMSWINMLRLEHYWGRVTHMCLSKLTIIGSDNVLSPGRHQAIIRTNAGILLIGPLGTNFSEMLIRTLTFSLKKTRLKVSSAKWRPFCLSLNVLKHLFLHSYWNFHWNLFQMVQFICLIYYDLLLIKDYINICHITGQWVKLSKIEITCTNDARQPCWCRHNRCRAPFYQLSITCCGSLGSRLSNERDGWCLLVISVGWSTLCTEVVSQPFLDEPTRKVKVKQWCE